MDLTRAPGRPRSLGPVRRRSAAFHYPKMADGALTRSRRRLSETARCAFPPASSKPGMSITAKNSAPPASLPSNRLSSAPLSMRPPGRCRWQRNFRHPHAGHRRPVSHVHGLESALAGHRRTGRICQHDRFVHPVPAHQADRAKASDPRLSIEERYPNKQAYLEKVKAAAAALIQNGFLLDRDVPHVMDRASAEWDLVTRQDGMRNGGWP